LNEPYLLIRQIYCHFRTATGIQNPVPLLPAGAVAGLLAITSLAVDHQLILRHVLDHYLGHPAAMVASIRAALGIHIQGHVLGLVHILVIADAVIAAIHEALAQGAADM